MDTIEPTALAVGEAVKKALEDAGISRRDAAERSGIPLTTLQRRISGHSPFRMNELATIAALTDTSVVAIVSAAGSDAA